MSVRPSRSNSSLFWLAFLPVILLSVWAVWRFAFKHEEEEAQFTHGDGYNEFYLPEAPKAEAAGPQTYVSRAELESRQRVAGSGGVLPGLVREARPGGGRADKGRDAEEAFVRENAGAIRAEQRRIHSLIRKYKAKYPIVRQVSKEVKDSPRIAALTRQCNKDQDFFKWARGVVQLPEFRNMVFKYSANPDAWKAGVGMTLEYLKNPPPAKVYTSMLKVVTEDPVASKHTPQLLGAVLTNMPSMVMQSVPPGTDLTPIAGLVGDVMPQGANVPMVDSSASNRYWAGYKQGYEDGRNRGAKKK